MALAAEKLRPTDYLAPDPHLLGALRSPAPEFDLRAVVDAVAVDKGQKLEVLISVLDEIGRGFESVIKPGLSPLAELEELIQSVETSEQEVVEQAANDHVELSRVKKLARKLRRDWLPILNDLELGISQRHQRLQGAYRDLRWRLMACRAELQKDAQGPTFSDPTALREYLKAHIR